MMSTTQSFIKGLAVAGAVATVFVTVSSPAQAINVGSSLTISGSAAFDANKIDFRGISDPKNDAAGEFTVITGTDSFSGLKPGKVNFGGFSVLVSRVGTISDISSSGPISKFLDFDGDEYDFDLTEALVDGNNSYTFKGFFTGGKTKTAGTGVLVGLPGVGQPVGYTASFMAVPTAVPTPALLPGLIGMGVAALRKRRGDAGDSAEA